MEEKEIEKVKGSCEDRTALLNSMVQEEMAKVQEDPMLFSNDFFFIEPMEGEIGPHCSAEIKVTFKPLEALEYRSVAYCSISGRETRLPLHLRGEGQGPLVELSSQTLNLGNIFVNTSHVCEVKLINQGAIDAPFTYIPSTTDMGFCFKFAPEEGIIAPGGTQTVQISFNAPMLGWFEEEFQFSVAGSPTPVILTIKGCVTGPSLHFDLPELDFGDISFGFPYTQSCRLTNTSVVPVMFKLRVLDDGTQPAVSSFDQIRNDRDPAWRKGIHFYVEPMEFTVNPSQGTILPEGHQDIEVTLCSNTVMKFYRKMLVDLEGIGEGVASLIISARCLVPELQVCPHVLAYNECYLKVPYEKKLIIGNPSHLPGCYGLIPQDRNKDSPVFYSSPKPCGIVQPHSSAEIPVIIEVQTLGMHRTNVLIGVFGNERNPLVYKPHCFVTEPREGVIPPRGEVPVTVTATLNDTGNFPDSIKLFTGNRLWANVKLQALGIGTTIVIDKPFAPELNLGYQFSPPEEEGQSVSALSSPKDDSQSPKRASPVFRVVPELMGLQPGQSVDMVLRGFSHIPQEVQDYVLCEAVIGTNIMKKKIIKTIITCEFIHPSIEVSARQFSFRVDKKPSDVLRLQYQPLALKNTCLLPLDLMLDLEQPFLICNEDQQPLPHGQPVRVDVGATCHLYIAFDPAYELDFKSWKKEKVLKIDMVRGHPFVERIILRGEVHFPNLKIRPSALGFGCTLAGTEEVRSLKMTNCSPLPVQYHWAFHSNSQVYRLRDELYPPKFKPQPPKEKKTCLDRPAALWRRYKMRNAEAARGLKKVLDFTQSLRIEVPPQIPENPHLPLGLVEFRFSMDTPYSPLEAEKAFSILPLSGVLQPGESQQVSFTLSGHLNTISNVTALCHVEGGPTYEVLLTGEVSRVSYSLRPREINCGLQMFNEIHHSKVTLGNTGKIEFKWVLKPSPADQHLPGVFLVKPTTGSIAPGKKQVLKFSYMPGFSGAFSRTYQLKVGDLDPENICLKGEASFPMISVNLPWNIKGNEKYEKTLKRLITRWQLYSPGYKSFVQKKTQSPKTKTLKSQTPTTQALKIQNPKTQELKPCVLDSGIVSNTQLQIKMMNTLVEKPFLKLQEKLTSCPLKSSFYDKDLCQGLVKVELFEYVLDMGPVLKGYTETHTLKISNPGQIHASFQVDVSVLQDTGFSVDLDQMNGLPPNHTLEFDVRFESAHKPQGDVEVVLPIEVTEGPVYNVRLHATVLELSLDLSKNRLQFSDILVGHCQVETIRLHNWFRVPCRWFITASKPVVKKDHLKYVTPAVRQKMQAPEDEHCPFEVTPSKGTLGPGKWQNLQIQFTPKEERSYKNELKLNICGSSIHLKLHLSGQGLEPRLEFNPPALKMGWLLVGSDGVEATTVVKNPCNFPIEFYSLDFDEKYLEEEKILRMAVGSKYQKSFFMPPRSVGETLPPEVLQNHEAQRRPEAQQAKPKARAEAEAKAMGRAAAELQWEKAMQRSIKHVLQMDKDEYDALPKEKKAKVDKIILEKKRIRRNRELKQLAQKLEEEAKALEEEERRKEEERQKEEERRKKEKKGISVGKQPTKPEKGKTKTPEKKETKTPEKKGTKVPEKKETKSPEKKETKAPEKKETKIQESKETKALEKKETKIPEIKETKGETKAPEKKETKALKKGKPKALKKGETKIPEDPAEMEKNLILRFQIYESSQQNVAQVFSYWDRVQGTVQLTVTQKGNKSHSSAENKGQKTSKPQEKVEKKPEQKSGDQGSLQSSQLETLSEVAEGEVRDEHIGVPCLDIQVSDPKTMIEEILRDGKLPTEDEMLKHVGLHPKGPPLPPGAVLSIVKYPEERLGPAEDVHPFTIVAPKGAAMEDNLVDAPVVPELKAKAPDAKGSSAKGQPKTGKATSRDSSAKEKQISTQRTESPRDSSATRSKSTVGSASVPTEHLRLKRYRWIVPAHGEVELKVHFFPKKPGRFKQTLRFELMQTKRQYELPCSGTGLYPSISQNPRVVFPQWRETMEEDEIIFKEYVESTKQFHFGPLLCGKSREWYKAQKCPSNSENLTILNNSPMDVEVQFSFEKDQKAKTFLLDPPSMTLKPKEKQELTIWAYPTSPGFLEDKLICSIGKNPHPVVFGLCCHGVHVKLEVSPLELSFDKLLLHRTDSRTLVLKNNSLLPMAWRLNGLDDLVEDFSLSQDNGTLDPRSEFEVTLHFKAEQIGSIERTLRLEVSDTENILGIVQAENIEISAEVYDVSLSIDMPEGPDGSLEFGTINVLDNVKKVLSLKNRGVYNIEYSFMLKGAGPRMRDVASYFTVAPQSGVLIASKPGVNVEILFHPTSEMFLKNKPILYCQVTDASSGERGETVANIPVKVSAKAVFSKYSIEPASPIDFGAMIKGTKKTQTVLLENKGLLNFKFCIRQAPKDASALESKSSKQGESAPSSAMHSTARKSSSLTQSHLSLGMFTVSPCSGSIGPWGQQMITVECLAGQEGTCEEQLYIDIPGRDPKDNPLGIPFTLIAESCLPGLAEDVMLIFEEYPICSSTNLERRLLSVKGTGLFVRDENRFIFSKVLVGQEAEAHFSIYSASSLPCDVVLSIKPLPGEEQIPINNIFKLDPVKMSVPGSSYAVATVTFTPPDEQNYNCAFKASLVIPKSSVKIKPQSLTFTISGKAHEPQLTVVRPSARSKRGNAVLRFRRLRLGRSEVLPLVIRNDGIIPVKFMLRLEQEHGGFFLKGRASTLKVFHTEDVEEDSIGNESKPTKPFFLLHCGESAEFNVIFKPMLAQRLEGKIRLLVGDIYSHRIIAELVGEGHKDKFTLDGLEEDTKERNADSSLKKDIIDAVRVNHIQFGDCPVGKRCYRTFTITNRTFHQFMRFEWETDGPFQFSPKVGHLRPRRAKDITVTLKSNVPATFRRHLVKCMVTKIDFALPPRKVPDWDDRKCIVSWNSTTRKDPEHKFPKIEKVVEPVPEPDHTVVEESSQEVEVYLSAIVAHTELKLNTLVVQFKDTLPFQTRTATFRMHNTGSVALEYFWEEPADSKPRRKPYSIPLMRRFLSNATVKHRKKLLRRYWWELAHPPKVRPRRRRLRWPVRKEDFLQWWCQLQQQLSEKQQLDSKQKKGSKKQSRSKELRPSEQQQQPSEQQQQQQPSEQQQQQPSEQQQQRPKKQRPKKQKPKKQQQLFKKSILSKKLRRSKKKHLLRQRVSSSLEIFPDSTHDVPLFSIYPCHGILAPGQKQTFHVQFSPKSAGMFKTIVMCRIPNLRPTQKRVRVILKGRAREKRKFGKPKRSALRQAGDGPRPKKHVHWKPSLE
ncbi:hydrocephalus-inducing protein-like [Motacilla alba alba]|uniref:hydrocephalus-inducing protein-like n=1 Tax=Motacilla alba alba TaxID=1094192 RepID=UPI0018D56437|nr:hydrocephalus-inducing protein-like [Motacilla alba alba]